MPRRPDSIFSVRCLGVVLAALIAAPVTAGAGKITRKNWMSHPQVKAVRKVFKDVEADLKKREITCKKRKLDADEPHADAEREMCVDGHGVVRKYVRAGGSEDSAMTRAFYYDAKGRLRFLFVTAGAVNGTEMQHRIYFNVRGGTVWEIQKIVKGPGYTFPTSWPTDDIIWKPRVAFADGTKEAATRPKTWRAVVSIIDKHENGSEDWGFFCGDIEEACKKAGNFTDGVDAQRPRAILGPGLAPVDEMDMSSFLAEKGQGWVLVEHLKGKTTTSFLPYDMTTKEKAQAFCAGGKKK